jgi:hypothetical protein
MWHVPWISGDLNSNDFARWSHIFTTLVVGMMLVTDYDCPQFALVAHKYGPFDMIMFHPNCQGDFEDIIYCIMQCFAV